MKISNFRIILLFLFITFVFLTLGCKGPEGPAGPNLKGDIIGYCHLVDVNGNQLSDNSGVNISIEGKSISTKSAADGRWVLSNISTGTYTLVFSKDGYGVMKSVGFQLVGGGQVYFDRIYLKQIPSFNITGLSATTSPIFESITISGTLNGSLPTGTRFVRFFIGKNSNVSSNPADYLFTNMFPVGSTNTTFTHTFSAQSLRESGIFKGQTVYIVAYGDSFFGSSYIDLSTGRRVYPDLNPNPSNIVSIVVP